MSKRSLAFIIVSVVLLSINAVYAPWSTLGTGYAITSDYHGIDVLPGTPVKVTAGTLDADVVQVTFRWHQPDELVAREVVVPVFTNLTFFTFKNGTKVLIRYAEDRYAPDVNGDWGVQALFQNSIGKDRANLEDVIAIKATSFNVIPEVPFGTIAILIGLFAALGVLAMKRKRVLAPGTHRRV